MSPSARIAGSSSRRSLKQALARPHRLRPSGGTSILIYHRVGGGTPDERDVTLSDFEAQVQVLAEHRVVSLDTALDELDAGDDSSKVVLTFDDGCADVYETAWPLLRDARLPFTIYIATAYVDGPVGDHRTDRAQPSRGRSAVAAAAARPWQRPSRRLPREARRQPLAGADLRTDRSHREAARCRRMTNGGQPRLPGRSVPVVAG